MHRGPAGLDRVILRELGGRYGHLVHQPDAVPVYRAGERVFVFLEAAPDGALRTSGMFFGKFVIEQEPDGRWTWAVRDLAGQGTILYRPANSPERIPLRDLVSLAAAVRHAPSARSETGRSGHSRSRRSAFDAPAAAAEPGPGPRAVPPEFARLLWDDIRTVARHDASSAAGASLEPQAQHGGTPLTPAFAPMSFGNPARWRETDWGAAVTVHVQQSGNPLGDGPAAVAEMQRALAAWTEIPEARVSLVAGNTNYNYTGTHAGSPAAVYSGTNVILFDDPYGEISDPISCGGVLAIGGYWRTTSITSTVNGVSFHSAVQLYVIFNNDFECILGTPDNLAEVATHELGHGIGFGHSSVPDAIMRAWNYQNRGPRLGDDDRDAAHCHYPHQLSLLSPAGVETWTAGDLQEIRWSATAETGPDDGLIGLEYSSDGGASWSTISTDEPNDGSYFWQVPDVPGTDNRVRVIRHGRTGEASAPFPATCSSDTSDGPFRIVSPVVVAGAVPDGSSGRGGLSVKHGPGAGQLRLSWGGSCSTDATDYAIYEGSLDALRSGAWDHRPATCSTGGALSESLSAQEGDRYFLVVPRAGSSEGHAGRDSAGALRPASTAACAPRETVATCE